MDTQTNDGFHPENAPVKRDGGKAPKVTRVEEAKDPFTEWSDKMDASDDEEVRTEGGQVAFNEIANQTLKESDQHLAECKAAAKEAGKQYADATKANKKKLEYCRALLQARGQEPSAFDLDLQSAS